jgi:hypothetical protein
MSRLLPRYTETRLDHERAVSRVILEAQDPTPTTVAKATLPGDTRRLRGIPVAGGACGTSPGTDPLAAAIAAETRRHLRSIH